LLLTFGEWWLLALSYGWAVGGNPLILPQEAGIRMGASRNAVKYFILEIHYDNPNREAGHVDQSGVKIYFTRNLRQYDAGTLMLGNIDTREGPIPPRLPFFHVESSCPSECTQKWPHSINVFADFQHMHNVGKMIWSTVHRDGERLPGFMSRIEYWEFNFQDNIRLQRTLNPGDRINTICIYDTTSRTTPTNFGSATTDAMCLEFLSYYPLLEVEGRVWSECGKARGQYYQYPDGRIVLVDNNKFRTGCGRDTLWDNNNLTVINPEFPDAPGDEIRTFGVVPPVCPTSSILDPERNIVWILVGMVGVVVASVAIAYWK